MNKKEIIAKLDAAHSNFWNTAIQSPNPTISINNKWSVSQNVQHINIGLLRLNNFLELPKSSIETNFGLSERASLNNESINKLFNNAFKKGVKATSAFTPDIDLKTSLDELINQGKKTLANLISNLQIWSEQELEVYNCPHPFLGKVTVREILYFTIYHVKHHHETIKK
jgi:hypothetical protein